ncbi:DUF6153 family protein [Streptomyces tunisiensis]|uniref:DUF6153 family protein n=1 Tax=Streptomyces tunisiensis TaxID=948699 RepID=UPI00403D7557
MRVVTARAQLHSARSPHGRWRVLLVLGLLVGLLGMHALGPGVAVAAGTHHSSFAARDGNGERRVRLPR